MTMNKILISPPRHRNPLYRGGNSKKTKAAHHHDKKKKIQNYLFFFFLNRIIQKMLGISTLMTFLCGLLECFVEQKMNLILIDCSLEESKCPECL